MTLNFQMRREDILAFTREFHAASPTFQRTRTRVRVVFPVVMLCFWLFTFATNGFDWIRTTLYLGFALLWYFLYPARFDRRIERYCEKTLDEASHSKSLGPCELTLSESGLHSKSNTGESTYYWSAVDRVVMTDTHLFIFLTGPIGYPIPIADVGPETARAAYDFALTNRATTA
jgi:hypothetical protein